MAMTEDRLSRASVALWRVRTWLSKLLCPSAHRSAERYGRLRGKMADYEQWLGTSHPEAASVVQHLLKDDLNYWTGAKYDKNDSLWWRSPPWVWDVSDFRKWLDTNPFDRRSS